MQIDGIVAREGYELYRVLSLAMSAADDNKIAALIDMVNRAFADDEASRGRIIEAISRMR